MSTDASALAAPTRLRPELALFVLWALCLALIPVHVGDVYSGLPAHPLFLHVPVILIPAVSLATVLFAARPRLFERYGVALAAVAVVALAGTILTVGAGKALRARRAGGPDASLISRHAHFASILQILMIVFTLSLIGAVALSLRSRSRRMHALRGLVAGLAVACLFFVVRTGDLGAKAVWANRGGGGPPAGFQGFQGGPRTTTTP